MKKALTMAVLAFAPAVVNGASLWEAGRLDYVDGSAEVAAFVNAPAGTQLQTVLCTRRDPEVFRVTLLLPKSHPSTQVFEVSTASDGVVSSAYAELNGNALEFQLDSRVVLSMVASPTLSLTFKPEDAALLQLPQTLEIPMTGADLTLRSVASECTALSLNENFNCRKSLVASLLWPPAGFAKDRASEIDALCTEGSAAPYRFSLNDGCKIALDRFFAHQGVGPLSFIDELMHREDGPFQRYVSLWNDSLRQMASGPVGLSAWAEDREWYLMLYSLAGKRSVQDFPESYGRILHHAADPTTFIYDIENRYELESLKYTAVLMRRHRGQLNVMAALEDALKAWAEFYREFSYLLPETRQAQALRVIAYRQMLLRIWQMAGRPAALDYRSENAFRQGTGGRRLTEEPLERQCSLFEGARRDEFFYPSEECRRGIEAGLHHMGLINEHYAAMVDAYRAFSSAWSTSPFADGETEAQSSLPEGLSLPLLTLMRIYGFGDYFLMRSCISTKDGDICALESRRAHLELNHEYHNKLASVQAVSREDGKTLTALQELYRAYETALGQYLHHEVMERGLPYWRAELVSGIAAQLQTDRLIAAPYREEMPDVSLGSEDDFEEGAFDPHSEIVERENPLPLPHGPVGTSASGLSGGDDVKTGADPQRAEGE